jgi:LuxR family quorum-sensing transcriptional regulator LasR
LTDSIVRLLSCDSEESWQKLVFEIARGFGYPYVMLALFPEHRTPLEPKQAFVRSNYAPSWRAAYDEKRLWHIDPTVTHCVNKTTPLVWSPQLFAGNEQRQLYEEACQHGIRAGVSLPMRGTQREFGVLCLASDAMPDSHFHRETTDKLPILSYLRDFILETALHFMKRNHVMGAVNLATSREIECLNWIAAGKTSWEVAQILRCSEATVNFHMKNLRQKFNVTTRQQAIVKAMHLGLLSSQT